MNHMRIHSMTRIHFTAAAAVIVAATLVASVLTVPRHRPFPVSRLPLDHAARLRPVRPR